MARGWERSFVATPDGERGSGVTAGSQDAPEWFICRMTRAPRAWAGATAARQAGITASSAMEAISGCAWPARSTYAWPVTMSPTPPRARAS